jgi:hypothetical protein
MMRGRLRRDLPARTVTFLFTDAECSELVQEAGRREEAGRRGLRRKLADDHARFLLLSASEPNTFARGDENVNVGATY